MIGLIVARSKNNVIGKNGQIPWRIKGEQKQFKELTTGNVVIMGRRSYEEIGKPLPNRVNIVVSGSKVFEGENLITVDSLQGALEIAKQKYPEKNVYIAGGYRLFEEALPLVDKMFITEVDLVVEGGDTFFPVFNTNEFDKEVVEMGGDEVSFTRVTYTKQKQLEKEVSDIEL